MSKTVLSMTTKLPPHRENELDAESLRGNDEDYFIKRMKKMKSERLEVGWFSNTRPKHYQPPYVQDSEGLA